MSTKGLLELLNAPWAIVPSKLDEMQAIYTAHIRGEAIDLDAIEARLGRPLSNEQQVYTIRDGGIAVLSIEGVIAPKANFFTRVSGGASAQMLTSQVESAIADPRVRGLVLQIDSPGGSVNGAPELAATVYELSRIKPIAAVSDALMASAAYWVGSAASQVYVSGPTVSVGSIGVVATHDYVPRRDGGQSVDVVAGQFKRITSYAAPLTAEGRAYLQAMVDHLYGVFLSAVAEHRRLPDGKAVHERMADGRIFIGSQAVDAGLVDGMATVDAIADQMAADPQRFMRRAGAGAAANPTRRKTNAAAVAALTATQGGPMPITREQVQAEAPELLAEIRAEGAQQERARIQSVRAQTLPGHAALVEQLAFDGVTTGPEAAVRVLNAERAATATRAQALVDDTPLPLPHDATAAPAGTGTASDPSKPAQTPMQRAHELAGFIAAKQAEAAAAGRTLSAVDALALVNQEP